MKLCFFFHICNYVTTNILIINISLLGTILVKQNAVLEMCDLFVHWFLDHNRVYDIPSRDFKNKD